MLDDQKDNLPSRPPVQGGRGNRFALVFFILVSGLFIAYFLKSDKPVAQEVPYSTFVMRLDRNEVDAVKIIDGNEIEGTFKSPNGDLVQFKTLIPYQDTELMPLLKQKGVRISGSVSGFSPWMLFLEFLPWLVGFVFIWLMFRNAQGAGNKAFQFGKSRAKRYLEAGKRITFADVAGQEEAKYELQEVVAFLKNPQKFTKMGAKIPKGVLLVGMPGTGKTLLAKAVAGEAGVAFFHMSGSDFVEMFVGVGASRVRDLFEQGRKSAPCIIFIDELDAVGRTRGAGYGGGHDEREQTLNQMLVEMDGFDSKDGVIILAATNRPDVLDPALLRPGRFDRQVVVAMPDIKEREAIFRIHASRVPLGADVDFARLARATPGTSGADIANLVNEAALFAARKDKSAVEMADFEEARDKILMGVARKSLVMSEKERRMTAIHESGHALLHYFLKNADPLHKVTIVPHGRALGMAMSLPEEDSYSRTRGWIEDRITIMYGGWAAEKLIYNETTTGTKQDLQQATELARRMVCEWGMSDEIGPVSYGQEEEPIFIGKEIARHKDYSEDMAQKIDKAVRAVLSRGIETAQSILKREREKLELLADNLMTRETLTDDEVRTLLGLPPRQATGFEGAAVPAE
ncbi:ATP-dependent zinc metalloprotease FtsH [Gracilinema caldarium]|jgi:cell division protease FtsH|uniref:ATP-dependent zinc metalloprotease FtsH n=1 Tax=Gracilinema caldarium TaxID=215591 RepID=UPI0016AC0A69|nr:ATP-dependent zinc metalloprotease FtsH [Gracilinema caldarium]NLJ11179.1 ATP-dependent metallopeptidase FtsH/Yme1/Tma family protein [Treponema sp.]